ncbi:hypothetical protein PG991_012183 [Apiospora marii]|uniref:Uncharacterized protein n=1 Tax=Apiospora marii TaxID=335849 RepID=A0ABR1R941_9PEZI
MVRVPWFNIPGEGKPYFSAPDGHSPWAMSCVCRTVHAEVMPLLNSIDLSNILFDFEHFNEDDMRRWISLPSADRSGEERVKGIRRWSMSNWGYCSRATYYNAYGRRKDLEGGGSEDDIMKEFNDQLLQFPGSDSDLMDLGLSDAKRMGVAAFCSRGLNVDFSSIKPETEDDICDFENDESLWRANICSLGSDTCSDVVGSGLMIGDEFDRAAWLRDGQPPVTGHFLLSLLHTLGESSMS